MLQHYNSAIPEDWRQLIGDELTKPYFEELMQFIEQEYACGTVFPPQDKIFRAFELCPLDTLKVVIIGQDPYHNDNQANGLSFSVSAGVQFPPSLKNIFREVADSGYTQQPENGELERWAKQGVLLLNSVLTVRAHTPTSHAGHGWERFTDAVIAQINSHKKGVVYLLWGSYAQKKASHIDTHNNLIIKSAHPSPLSAYRGFLGSGQFKTANDYLQQKIEW